MKTRRLFALSGALLLGSLTVGAIDKAEAAARERFIRIIEKLEKARFCQSGRCRYTDVRFEVRPTGVPAQPFKGLIRAGTLRPSQALDQARYQFVFSGGRWRLVSGSETTDVNEATYSGEHYEFSSAYGRAPIQGSLTSPGNDLETGYKLLYLKILNRGEER